MGHGVSGRRMARYADGWNFVGQKLCESGGLKVA